MVCFSFSLFLCPFPSPAGRGEARRDGARRRWCGLLRLLAILLVSRVSYLTYTATWAQELPWVPTVIQRRPRIRGDQKVGSTTTRT